MNPISLKSNQNKYNRNFKKNWRNNTKQKRFFGSRYRRDLAHILVQTKVKIEQTKTYLVKKKNKIHKPQIKDLLDVTENKKGQI